jgi:hypothetical protein
MVEAGSHLKLLTTFILDIYKVFEAVHWHTAAALNSYIHLTWLIFWVSGSLVESK